MGRVAFIGVSYNTNLQSADLLRSFSSMPCADQIDVVIVNNSAISEGDASLGHLKKIFPSTKIINAPDNPGYFGGVRRALANIDFTTYRWIIVANVDIEIRDKCFFEKLLSIGDVKEVGVLAPSLMSSLSGHECNPFLRDRPRSSRMAFYRWVFSNWLTSWVYHMAALTKYFLKSRMFRRQQEVAEVGQNSVAYAAHGAFMIFSPEYFHRGGTLNYGAYMYGEEIFIGEKCRQLNLQTVFIPSLRVFHIERASTGLFYSKKVLAWKKDSSRYLWKEFFSE